MLAHLAILVAIVVLPRDNVLRESCDVIHVNAYFDELGREVFTQAIFLEVNGEREDVRAWRLIKDPSQLPVKDHERGDYECTWQDGDVLRQVRTKSVVFSWTQWDIELEMREKLPKEKRRGLRSTKAK
jgi:hypothetical protein